MSQYEPYSNPPPAGQPPAWGPAGYGPYPMTPPREGTNGLAVASLVLGILWVWWIGSILALIFGYVAKGQLRENRQGGGGLATAGIVLGWVGVGFLALFLVFAALGVATSGGGSSGY